jgi:hypothetical protein
MNSGAKLTLSDRSEEIENILSVVVVGYEYDFNSYA